MNEKLYEISENVVENSKIPLFLGVNIELSQLRPIAFRIFTKRYNLTLKSDALKELAIFIGRKFGQDWHTESESVLDEIAQLWKKSQESNFLVSKDLLIPILKKWNQLNYLKLKVQEQIPVLLENETLLNNSQLGAKLEEKIDIKQYYIYIDAFNQPKYIFDITHKSFERSNERPKILGDISHKISIYRERFYLIKQRLLSNPTFQEPGFYGSISHKEWHKITSIKNLLGRIGKEFMLLGVISYGPEGKLWLEDIDDRIMLETDDTINGGGWIVPGCIVLADGIYLENGTFQVFVLGHPPCEPKYLSEKSFDHIDFLGTNQNRLMKKQLKDAETKFSHVRLVFAADVILDDILSMKALKKMLYMYETRDDIFPEVIILMGNFISVPFHNTGFSANYKALFNSLALLLESFPKLTRRSTFIFLPGPNDPWAQGGAPLLPQRGIPKIFTNRIRKSCKHVFFASNPSRLLYFTQDIVLYRDNTMERLRRHSLCFNDINAPSINENKLNQTSENSNNDASTNNIMQNINKQKKCTSNHLSNLQQAQNLVRTLLDQSHLSPFSLSLRPIIWDFDHTLRLYPIPHLMVIADTSCLAFNTSYCGCLSINPGKLVNSYKASWAEYNPAENKVVIFEELI
ncbi:hypothetical protein PNEG_00958 [Pneumocystis murina B123]|uniref:DNA polymerase epsilon subunit B n=1 Tax=Pneumocystis murina (strain B123) TaxID=1069680 RepID=M7NUP4_PNEMU|nr:hypothetical protein PNEG_00958 [Pneumocystis murina B123]EMR10811.1 hypothetical protein PNEG_00958 [Pneumocystis murina B123]